MRAVLIPVLAMVPALAEARICAFDFSQTDGGDITVFEAPYKVEIDIPNGQLITPDASVLNEGYVGNARGETMLFRGDNKTYLLSVAKSDVARLTIHTMDGDPISETYSGSCEAR